MSRSISWLLWSPLLHGADFVEAPSESSDSPEHGRLRSFMERTSLRRCAVLALVSLSGLRSFMERTSLRRK